MNAQPIIVVGNVDITITDTEQRHVLGLELDFTDGKRRKYIRAGAAIAAGDSLKIDYAEGPNDMDPTGAVNQPIAAYADRAFLDNEFGWVITAGQVAGAKLTAGTAAGAQLGSSAVAGTAITLTCAGANPTQAEAQQYMGAMAGRAVMCTVLEAAGVGTVYIR